MVNRVARWDLDKTLQLDKNHKLQLCPSRNDPNNVLDDNGLDMRFLQQ